MVDLYLVDGFAHARGSAVLVGERVEVDASVEEHRRKHVINGELPLAVDQLKLALAQPSLEMVQRARFQARLEEIQQYLPENARR